MHDTLSVMNTRCFHWVLWELSKWWWFLKVWASLALFDGIIETISMAFLRNIFQAYTGIFVFENNVFTFWAQNARAAAAPWLQGKENGFIALGVSVVDQKHEMQSNCPDSFYNFQNIEISKVVSFHWRWVCVIHTYTFTYTPTTTNVLSSKTRIYIVLTSVVRFTCMFSSTLHDPKKVNWNW